MRIEETELTEKQIIDLYDKCDCKENEYVDKVNFINSGMVGSHYWLGYVLGYADDNQDSGLEVVLDGIEYNKAIYGMMGFLRHNKLDSIEDKYKMNFQVITRWG